MVAKFRDVERALDAADGDIDKAVEALRQDPAINKQVHKLNVREQLFKKMPLAHPTSKQIEHAIQEMDGNLEKAAEMLEEDPVVQEAAKETYKTWSTILKDAAAD